MDWKSNARSVFACAVLEVEQRKSCCGCSEKRNSTFCEVDARSTFRHCQKAIMCRKPCFPLFWSCWRGALGGLEFRVQTYQESQDVAVARARSEIHHLSRRSCFFKPENHPSVEQVLAATKSDATLANVPKTLCFPLFSSRANFVQFKWTWKMHHFLTPNNFEQF